MECVYVFSLALVIVMLNRGVEAGCCKKLESSLSDKLVEMLCTIKSGGQIEDNNGVTRPAFTVTLSGRRVSLNGVGDILKFNNAILNRGKVYNITTGKFTAPQTGLYQLSVTVMANSNKAINLGLYQNNIKLMNLYGPALHGATETANPVLELTKGDTVDVRNLGHQQTVNADGYSYMSGYYIGK